MKCTACDSGNLVPSFLDDLFRCHTCDNCGGNWILIEDYIGWKERHPEHVFSGESIEAEDSPGALICPMSGGIMRKFRVAKDNAHRLDYSARVGGVWLHKGEWEMLVAEGLAGNLNAILTDQWQHRIRKEKASESLENLYRSKFGDADYEKACDIREWLHAHPHKCDIRAFLMADSPFSAS
ncbi:MAG: TFIIB-type zinc ribbon-containing protein [Halomonadaceae bacterium]|jgi:Zn-finger nucleic acid-binding protein|uniref:TFIIB-type zinc ribbon-containing protein n=1 Tax=Halomonas sp. MCCC 1A11062 TaxID=2733485 RepID=UPI001F1ADCB3|nr:zf-TFIIB domain-containing protein [Halomonas sp. MCCC 1A11062]MCE8036112.1 zf-TFIIB domain-containing protein [Halomonas sp. MCCC 1A11062]